MEDKDIKDGINRYIGKQELFNDQFRNRLLSNLGKKQKKPRGTLVNRFMPAFVMVLLVFGGITYFLISNDPVNSLTTANKGTPDKNLPVQPNPDLEETSEITFDMASHGTAFPELKSDLNDVLISLVATLTDPVNAVSINESGTVVVDLIDFRKDLSSLTTNEKGEFLWPLYDTVFKYPQVEEVYFTFDGSFTSWYEWLESTPDPMIRQTEQISDNTDRLVDTLLTNYTYYNDMYQFILEAKMPDEKAGNVVILYLEALKNGDVEQIKKYSVTTENFKPEKLLDDYKQIDYNSLYIDKIIPSQGEPIYDVHLNFKLKNGNSGKRVIYVQFYDEEISIFDFSEN